MHLTNLNEQNLKQILQNSKNKENNPDESLKKVKLKVCATTQLPLHPKLTLNKYKTNLNHSQTSINMKIYKSTRQNGTIRSEPLEITNELGYLFAKLVVRKTTPQFSKDIKD